MTRAAAAFVVLAASSTAALAQPAPESVYPPPEPTGEYGDADDPRDPTRREGFHFDLDVRYLTDHVWRGIERFDVGDQEDAANVQFQGRLRLDLGKLPHPYVDVLVNVAEDDPVSSFQEVRPEVGFDWNIRPLTLSAGYTSYVFPDREGIDTSEIFVRLELDDSMLFRTERPLFNPYAFGAYDIEEYSGAYVEVGVQHQLPVEGTGLVFIANAHVAYVSGFDLFADVPGDGSNADGSAGPDADDSGFQHWQVGLTARYTLNQLLNIPDRYGQVGVEGFLNYTDGIDDELESTNQLWGGVGISLKF